MEIAEAELLAVRDLLAQLEREVGVERRAAEDAERRSRVVGSSLDADLDAVERSRRIVEEMAATREASWRTSFEEARVAAEARLAEATRLAEELAAASRRHAEELLAQHLPVPPIDPPAPVLIAQAADTNEAFWREEAQATAARSAATKAVESIAPIEALLPVLALVLLLVAVLVLIG